MSIWRTLLDTTIGVIRSEANYRRENPEDTAKMFRRREAHWRSRGRPVLERIARRRAERWEARIPKSEGKED